MTSSYENAPSTTLLATHCALCGRPLRDADSVERGVGPDCAEKHGYGDAQGEADWDRVDALLIGGQAHQELFEAVAPCYGQARGAANAIVHHAALTERKRRRLALVSATEPFDTSTAVGRAMLGMLGVWAQLEADMTSQRTKDALAVVKASGKRLGAPRAVDLSPELVMRVAKLREQGLTLRAIAAKLNDDGVPGARGGKWWTKTVAAALDQAAAATANDNRQRRDARCPVHGCSLGQIGVWQRGNRSGPTVGCPRQDCMYTEEVTP